MSASYGGWTYRLYKDPKYSSEGHRRYAFDMEGTEGDDLLVMDPGVNRPGEGGVLAPIFAGRLVAAYVNQPSPGERANSMFHNTLTPSPPPEVTAGAAGAVAEGGVDEDADGQPWPLMLTPTLWVFRGPQLPPGAELLARYNNTNFNTVRK